MSAAAVRVETKPKAEIWARVLGEDAAALVLEELLTLLRYVFFVVAALLPEAGRWIVDGKLPQHPVIIAEQTNR